MSAFDRVRSVWLASCLGGVAALASCADPTGPTAAQRRYEALLEAPAYVSDAARQSAFGGSWAPGEFTGTTPAGNGAAVRTAEHWSFLWGTLNVTGGPATAPAVDFASELVVVAFPIGLNGYPGSVVIRHTALVRDTLFVLASVTSPDGDCATPSEGVKRLDARVLPATPVPVEFLIEQRILECGTFRVRVVW